MYVVKILIKTRFKSNCKIHADRQPDATFCDECSVSVENAADALKHPMRDVLVSLQIGIEDQALTHRVSSGLGHVDGGLNRAAELEFVDLNWYNLHQWKLLNKLLGTLVVEAVLLNVPPGAFKVDTLHVGSVLESLSDVVGVELLSYNGVKS